MTWDSNNTLGSEMQLNISSTYTPVPGIQNIDLDTGTNSTRDAWDIADTYEKKKPTGIKGGGKLGFKRLVDVLDVVDQFIHAVHNNNGVPSGASLLEGKAQIGETGVLVAFSGTLTTYKLGLEKKAGVMADGEVEFYDQVDLNEADPA